MYLHSCHFQDSYEDFSRFDTYFKNIKELNFDDASASLDQNHKTDRFLYRLACILLDNGQRDKHQIESKLNFSNDEENRTFFEETIENLMTAYFLLWYENDRIESYQYFRTAYEQSLQIKYDPLIKLCLRSVLYFYKESSLQTE
ncbi:MAG: hypothetical protein GKR88_11735 [Flavobacteriaceae bacterium]|nr:MAG: hypothetical protein GKR88_11735 [Flavobacteriaceae bacterium]